jgi:hypothetical protein
VRNSRKRWASTRSRHNGSPTDTQADTKSRSPRQGAADHCLTSRRRRGRQYVLSTKKKHVPTRVFCGLIFLCVVFGFQLLGRVWFVFIVLALDVLGSLRRSFSMILVAPPSVIHTFSSNIFAITDKILQGYPRRRTAYTFPFSRCHKTGHRNSLHAI